MNAPSFLCLIYQNPHGPIPLHPWGLGDCAKELHWGTWQGLRCSAGRDGCCVDGRCIGVTRYTRGSVLYVCTLQGGCSSAVCAPSATQPVHGLLMKQPKGQKCQGRKRDGRNNCSWSCCSVETTGVNVLLHVLKGQQIYCPPLWWIEIKQDYKPLCSVFCYF